MSHFPPNLSTIKQTWNSSGCVVQRKCICWSNGKICHYIFRFLQETLYQGNWITNASTLFQCLAKQFLQVVAIEWFPHLIECDSSSYSYFQTIFYPLNSISICIFLSHYFHFPLCYTLSNSITNSTSNSDAIILLLGPIIHKM